MLDNAVTLNEADLTTEALVPKKKTRPDLRCKFCTTVKAYSTIYGIWSHIFLKHTNIANAERLQEIQRTASLWRAHWAQDADGGRGGPTVAKLAEAELPTFSWEDVIKWDLR